MLTRRPLLRQRFPQKLYTFHSICSPLLSSLSCDTKPISYIARKIYTLESTISSATERPTISKSILRSTLAKERKIYISEPLVSQTVTRYKKRKKTSKKFPNFSNKDTSRRYIKEIERERNWREIRSYRTIRWDQRRGCLFARGRWRKRGRAGKDSPIISCKLLKLYH